MMFEQGLIIVLTIALILFIFAPNFFNIECMCLVLAIYVLVVLLYDDTPNFIHGGTINSMFGLANNLFGNYWGGTDTDFHSIDHSHDYKILGGESPHMKMELMDPKHNMREIAKQMILLEDHMAHRPKRCVDCITKHYLMVEGLLEEAITLDKTSEMRAEIENISNRIKPIMMNIIQQIKADQINDTLYDEACQSLRTIRKEIAGKYILNN